MTKMRKLILLVAVATTMSFAACTNTTKPEQTEEVAIENATETLEEATENIEAATEMLEEAADSLAVTVD
jgi:PBP1b-binding outer membrane lipoprotein LpoB